MLVHKELISCPEGFLMEGGVELHSPGGKQRPGPEAVVVNSLGSLTPMEKGAHNSFGRELDFIFGT